VTDSGLTGYVWSQSYGWINLDPTNGGVINDGEGDLSGYAWGEDVGWINFQGATINDSGQFTGTIGSATSTAGLITFDCTYCDVQTDWRPQSMRNAGAGTGAIVNVPSGYGTPYGVAEATSSVSAASSTTASSTLSVLSASSMCTANQEACLAELEAELQALLAQAAKQGIFIQGTLVNASGSSYTFTRNLSLWSTGKDVQQLQLFLIAQNSGPAARKLKTHGVTHAFGPLTFNALVEFQREVGIRPASGYFGPITRAYLEAHQF
jgi:hypothetical protein